MIRSSQGGQLPRRLLIAAAAALIPILAGCGTGTSAQTQQWHQPTDGSTKTVGKISINDAFVLGAAPDSVLAKGQNAGLFLALVNTGQPDRLLRISAPGTAASVRVPGGSVSLRSQHTVLLTGPSPALVLTRLTQPLRGGSVVTLRLTFQNAGTVWLKVPVMPRAQYYQTFSPAPAPASPSPTASHGAAKPTNPAKSAKPTKSAG